MNYSVLEISGTDDRAQHLLDKLLAKEGIRRDNNLEYMLGVFDQDYNLLGAGGFYKNTLRCLAVDSDYQGEGLMALIVSRLTEIQFANNNRHLFLYTKCENEAIFSSLAFYEVARVQGAALLMENQKTGFSDFLGALKPFKRSGKSAAVVVNCNPFTLGHRHLIEQAAQESDVLHVFVVSEDASFFPFADRYDLVQKGIADITNIVLHQTGSYMISSAVFPSYFLPDQDAAMKVQTKLDIEIFIKIANVLNITTRYVGEEPLSVVTAVYNKTMGEELQKAGIDHVVIKRKEKDQSPISASRVRQLIKDRKIEETKQLIPQSTYDYLYTDAGKKVIAKIQDAEIVTH